MKDIQILSQLLNGNHLEPKELKRAEQLLNSLTAEFNSRKQ